MSRVVSERMDAPLLAEPREASATNVDETSRAGSFVPFTINAGPSTNLPYAP
jgi:hypothetical protein